MVAEVIPLRSSRSELVKERARDLLAGKHKVFEVLVGGAMGVDLSTYRCSICEGQMAPIGRALIYYDEDSVMWALHRGCFTSMNGVSDLEGWANPDGDDDAFCAFCGAWAKDEECPRCSRADA